MVVIGTIRPPRTTCGMSAIGVSAIAASADDDERRQQQPERRRVHRDARPSPELEEERHRPAVEAEREEDDPEQHRALDDAEEAEEDVLREHVVEEAKVHHPLAQVDRHARSRSRARRCSCRTRRSSRRRRTSPPCGRSSAASSSSRFVVARWPARSSSTAPGARRGTRTGPPASAPPKTNGEHDADDRRLEEHDRRAHAVADLHLPVARHEEAELPHRPRRRRGAGPRAPRGRCRSRAAPSTSAGRRGFAFWKNSARHACAASSARRLRGGVRIAPAHLLEHEALAHVEHVEHVARVVDVACGWPTRAR